MDAYGLGSPLEVCSCRKESAVSNKVRGSSGAPIATTPLPPSEVYLPGKCRLHTHSSEAPSVPFQHLLLNQSLPNHSAAPQLRMDVCLLIRAASFVLQSSTLSSSSGLSLLQNLASQSSVTRQHAGSCSQPPSVHRLSTDPREQTEQERDGEDFVEDSE